jgi:signal recognition particle receptor subunit beta
MAIVNHETREATFKIVYAGTPVSGKTTNLAYIHSRIEFGQRGDLLSLATSTDRTLYFDFMPVTAMMIHGYQTKFVIYTVPGQVHYNATRQLVLRGADGIVFVADSHPDRMQENLESARTLVKNLRDNGLSIGQVPLVLQYNKRDLPEAAPRAHLDYLLNRLPQPLPAFETVASRGVNVFATLNAVTQMVLQRFHSGTPASMTPRHNAGVPEPAVAS